MFLGVARVPISCLDFSRAGLAGHRELKDSNVQRLLQIFNIEGCDRAEEKHFVKGYLATSGLQEPLPLFKPDQFTNHDSTSIPLLEHTVICCEGLHRIRAAARFFESTDEWWVVKLYSEAGMVIPNCAVKVELTNRRGNGDQERCADAHE
jgi:hypothetical protein